MGQIMLASWIMAEPWNIASVESHKVDKKLQYSLGSKLCSKPGWHTQEESRSSYRTVNLKNAALSATALKAVLAFMYTERLDVTIEDVDAVLRVAKKCKMHAVCHPIIKLSVKHSQWIQF